MEVHETLPLMSNDLNFEVLGKTLSPFDPIRMLGNPDLPTWEIWTLCVFCLRELLDSNVYLIQPRSFKTVKEDIRKRISYILNCGF
ncbi:hypothetical protein AVEN_141787-1 [Araneus ventricosus]|uniref:Uncharacterized protein n=1 Tax=Araneus ventricosus TaxID=182803 RepID=A0A4Y2QW80_ARAVE|nr:hypothetical protein AVEN_141787-1 [Araneus ventricosus]